MSIKSRGIKQNILCTYFLCTVSRLESKVSLFHREYVFRSRLGISHPHQSPAEPEFLKREKFKSNWGQAGNA